MIEHKNIRDAMVREYLVDLEVALAGADPIERAETLASIREHLELALGADATEDQVEQVFESLGSTNAIAAEVSPRHFTGGYGPESSMTASWQASESGQPIGQSDSGNQSSSAKWIFAGSIVALLLAFPLFSVAAVLAVVCIVAGIMGLWSNRGNRNLLISAIMISVFVLCAILVYFFQVQNFLLYLNAASGV